MANKGKKGSVPRPKGWGTAHKRKTKQSRAAQLRVLAQPWTIRSIMVKPPDIIFEIEDLSKAQRAFHSDRAVPGSVRMPDPRTIHWRLPPAYLEPSTLVPVLRKLLSEPCVS